MASWFRKSPTAGAVSVRLVEPPGRAAVAFAAKLTFEQVAKDYGQTHALKGVSLTVEPGEIVCLLGPSGCGKTTLLRIASGIETPTSGRVLINDQEVAGPNRFVPPEKRNVGLMFQDFALFPHLTILDNVAFGLTALPRAEAIRQSMGLLARVGLQHYADQYPHILSGGEQQRVALARALAPGPALLLLDEPFANLDFDLRERLGGELRQLLKISGTTALMVTHDQHEAFAIADEIGVMQDGQIQQWSSAYALYHQPANRFVADFVGQGTFLPALVTGHGQVQLELGTVQSHQPVRCTEHGEPCPDGCPVDVLLRPDDVVHDDTSPVTAEVVSKAFRGAEFLYTLRLDSGATVLSLVPSHHDHGVGERIGIRLELDHVVAYKRADNRLGAPALICA